MTLIIKRRRQWLRKTAYTAVWLAGTVGFVSAPLSQALSVHAPSKITGSSSLATTRTYASPSTHQAVTTPSKTGTKTTKSSAAASVVTPATPPVTAVSCTSSSPMHIGLASAFSSQLQSLSQYEQVCHSGIVSTMSFFTAIPTTQADAQSDARDVVAQLKSYASFGITPLVFLEPTTPSGGLIDMASYNAGAYDSALDTYFAAIKSAGVTDQMMGTWVPFPEGNIPTWTSVDPNVFTASVIKTVTFQKKYFPTSKASILLDTMTYPSAANWNGGQAISLLPYVQNMPAGLLDSFGLQGFPWVSPANQGAVDNGEPQNYLQVGLAAQAARALGVHNIWLNTGTFGVKYAGVAGSQVIISPNRRAQLLSETVSQVKVLQSQGFTTSVHLFAQDKSNVEEATNWSYWPSGQASTSPATAVFISFVHQLQTINAPLWLFDTSS